jgi:WD40 repeat protein
VAVADKAYVWDTSNKEKEMWTSKEKVQWAGVCSRNDSRVLATVDSKDYTVRFHKLDRTARVLGEFPFNVDEQEVSGPSSSASSSSRAPPARRPTEIKMMAFGGQWLAGIATTSWNLMNRNEMISVMDVSTMQQVGYKKIGSKDTPSALAVQSLVRDVVIGFNDGAVRVWGVPRIRGELELKVVLEGHKDLVVHMAMSHNGNYLCTGSRDSTLYLWKRQSGTGIFQAQSLVSAGDKSQSKGVIQEEYRYAPGNAPWATSLCCDGSYLVYVTKAVKPAWEQTASLFDIADGRNVRSFGKKSYNITRVALKGDVLATSSSSKSTHTGIELWHAPTGVHLGTISNNITNVLTTILVTEPEEDR